MPRDPLYILAYILVFIVVLYFVLLFGRALLGAA